MADNFPRPEYPRPDLVRRKWRNLNGAWRFAFDDEDVGLRLGWPQDPSPLDREIQVPFPYQAPLSGVGMRDLHPVVWYARPFTVPEEWAGMGVLLRFGAVDYRAQVWVNGALAMTNVGGHVPFYADVTPLLRPGENLVVVRVEDCQDPAQPRGKQSLRFESHGARYTRTTGIWQTVWLEPVPALHVAGLRLLPDLRREVIRVGVTPSLLRAGTRVRAHVTLTGSQVASAETEAAIPPRELPWTGPHHGAVWLEVPIAQPLLWTPENPDVYDIAVELMEGDAAVDRVESYFGMREVCVDGGRFLLNGDPCTPKMVLDQGYWPDGAYTAPSDDALRHDVEMAKAFGFNGARKHQKVEDPRYYYWADRLGLLVWAEMPNCFTFSEDAVAALTGEWQRAVRRDWNHPCVVTWVPMNESWGLEGARVLDDPRQASYLRALYHLTKALDETRPVVDNDGWHHAQSDIATVHDYEQDPREMVRRALSFLAPGAEAAARPVLLPGFALGEQPVMITEYGGAALPPEGRPAPADGWGYGRGVSTPDELLERFAALTGAIHADDRVAGYCYTQLYDVENEINGLMADDRRPKVEPDRIARVQEG